MIERALEVLKTAYDVIDSHFNLHKVWTAKTTAIAQDSVLVKVITQENSQKKQIVMDGVIYDLFDAAALKKGLVRKIYGYISAMKASQAYDIMHISAFHINENHTFFL